jgi:hypothetical protein
MTAFWNTKLSGTMTGCFGVKMVPCADGTSIIVFSGIPVGGVRGLYAHKVGGDGAILWPTPMPIRTYPVDGVSTLPDDAEYQIIPDDNGGAVIFWSEKGTA